MNSTTTSKTFGLLSASCLAICLAAAAVNPAAARADVGVQRVHAPDAAAIRGWPPRFRTLRFDVAENHKRFFFDEAPLLDNGLPAAGNAFVTEGFIYPYGFLTEDEDGVTDDGKPTAPEKVLGRWICRGHFIGDGAATTTGPWVVTSQYYEFGERAGRISFTTEGVEVADVGVTIKRGITGGTGPLRMARGQVRQVLTGFQSSEAVKLRFVARFD